MTGFGRGTSERDGWAVSVTIRGVNHRALDVVLRSRLDLGETEGAVRERAVARFTRGRVEIAVEGQSTDNRGSLAQPVPERLAWAKARADELARQGLLPAPATTADLLRWPGVLETGASASFAADAGGREALHEALERALGQFAESRLREGEALDSILRERIIQLRKVAGALRERREQVREEIRVEFDKRIAEALGRVPADPNRVAQEVAFLIERGDVREELDRLDAHLLHFEELLQAPSPGRRLDFLTQEILRELNTLGSKARDTALVRAILDGKTLCEQLREQVQNVE